MTEAADEVENLVVAWGPPGSDATIYQRLAWIQSRMPSIGKDTENRAQGFKYRSHDDVLNALNPLMAAAGVFVVPRVRERITGQRTTEKNKTMYEVNLLVEFAFYGIGGDHGQPVIASAWGEGTDLGDKSTNKATTMAFKNVLAIVFAIATDVTHDTDADSDPESSRARDPKTIDPGFDLLPGAPNGDDALKVIAEIFDYVGGGVVDWAATMAPYLQDRFQVSTRAEIPAGALTEEYWRRMSNIAARLRDENDLDSFPPLAERDGGPTTIEEVLKWGFGTTRGGTIEFTPINEPGSPESGDQIPWTDEVKEALGSSSKDAASSEPSSG